LLELRPKAGGGSTAGGPVRWNNPRAVRRIVNPDIDSNNQAMMGVMERPKFETGTVFTAAQA
jgi:hypothetical protein